MIFLLLLIICFRYLWIVSNCLHVPYYNRSYFLNMTVFDIIKIYNPRSAKQVPPPFPLPTLGAHSLLQISGGWRETGILSISERVHFYKNNNNSTDTIYVWLMRTWRWECRLCFGGGFSHIGILHILPAWHTYFYLGGRVHGWPRHKSLSHGASFLSVH